MNIEKFRDVIKRRKHVEEISCGEWSEAIEECQKQVVEMISEDIPSAIDFLNTQCTADEYSYIGEVLEDVAERTASISLVQCYKALMTKFPEECEKYNVVGFIEGAEAILRWEAEHGKEGG